MVETVNRLGPCAGKHTGTITAFDLAPAIVLFLGSQVVLNRIG
jgi:hypothetical protein